MYFRLESRVGKRKTHPKNTYKETLDKNLLKSAFVKITIQGYEPNENEKTRKNIHLYQN